MTTIGMLIVIDETIVHLTDAVGLKYPAPFGDESLALGPFLIRPDYLAILVVSIACFSAIFWLMHRTRFGRAMRAVAERPEAAQILGVSVRRVNVLTFVLTSAMAGIIGFFAAVSVGSARPEMAAWLTGKGLVVMVLGGLGSFPGAILGGLALGAYLAGMSTALWGLHLLPALALGVVVAAVVGLLVGFPALRVRGLYLAIATFGFGEIVRLAFLNVRYTRRIGDRVVGPNASEGFRHVRYIYDRGITPLEYLGLILLALVVVVILFYFLEL